MTHEEKLHTLNTLAGTIAACAGAIKITKNSDIATESRQLQFAATETALEAVRWSKQLITTLNL